MRRWMTVVVVLAIAGAAALAAGCSPSDTSRPPQVSINEESCGGGECHGDVISAQADGVRASLACGTCHEGTGEQHASNPQQVSAVIDWRIDSCAGCHEDEAVTYLYDDNMQVGPFGGSRREPPIHKTELFPEYNTIVAGHGFTRDYREEGAHKYLLQDHYETQRGKFETCLQCKSTKVAYVWDTGDTLEVAQDTEVELAHTQAPGVEARKVTIPAGTTVTYASDKSTTEVDARAVFPDGTTWTSKPGPDEDAAENFNMVWASSIAAIEETLPYGAGCNHCHDPHTGEERLIRKAMLHAIENDGGPGGAGGVNPYHENSPKDWRAAPSKDRENLLCAQCHVEYTCGASGVDGIVRDGWGWSKAKDLHELYTEQFSYTQDWRHALVGEPLIKSQHPEMELYWDSVHDSAGVSCVDCHMPEVRRSDGSFFRSHWFTSPYKYGNEGTRASFEASTGVRVDASGNACTRCHGDRTGRAIEQQQAFYERQGQAERLIARSATEFERLKNAKEANQPFDQAAYDAALDAHRRAHVLWENIAVSENSMGFHNFQEAMASMDEAIRQAEAAIAKVNEALP